MPPAHPRTFGGGPEATALSPLILAAMIVAVILIAFLPRKYTAIPLLVIAIMVPIGEGIVLGGAHFFVNRIVVLAGLVRVRLRREAVGGGTNSTDRFWIGSIVCQAAAVIILFHDMPAVVNQVGMVIDTAGLYLLLRTFIRNEQEMYRALKCLAIVSAVVAAGMIIEHVVPVNVFSCLGGHQGPPEIRDGRVRSQGVFMHPLLAGAFGATLFPLCLLLWRSGKARLAAGVGIAATTAMTITASSSTPLLAYAAGVLGICMWPVRRRMRTVRRGIVVTLVGLALLMKAPVWFVISHVDLTGSSSSYQRALVVDTFIRHFADWWLIGVKDTGTWGWGMWDTQNQYANVGQTGGLLALVLFIGTIVNCFSRLGRARKAVGGAGWQEWCIWLLGAALSAHVVGFFGVNYFDQSRVGWSALLAMISAVTTPILVPRSAKSSRTVAMAEGEAVPVNSEAVRV